jgi:hypothetical protein
MKMPFQNHFILEFVHAFIQYENPHWQFHVVCLWPFGIIPVFMGNPLKSILQIGNSKIVSRYPGSWPAALATQVGIEDELTISEIFKGFYR